MYVMKYWQIIEREEFDPSLVHVDRLICAVAARQHGVIVWEQLVTIGAQRGAIEHRVKRGLLHALHRGVYLCGRPADDLRARAMAAVIACGERAVVSHTAAATLWEIRPEVEGPITVTIVGDRARHAGIRAHQTHSLDPSDRKVLRGIPVTSAARTLLDNAFRPGSSAPWRSPGAGTDQAPGHQA